LARLFADRIELGFQMVQLQALQEVFQFHHITSS
jgi:hypothetical protein